MAVPNITVNMNLVPKLTDHRFDIWKEKFIMYLFSLDERFPDVLTMGPLIPMMINTRRVPRTNPSGADDTEEVEELVPKPKSQWTDEDKSLESLNRRLCFILGMACNDDTYIHIKGSANAKVMWERLLIYIEGDQRAKDNKLFNCQHAFDTFKKDPKESLKECYNRYVEVINNCSSLGKDYSPKELNMRFLLCLGNLWHVKVTTIKDTRDLNTLDLASLYGDLRVYEDTLLLCQKEDKNFNGLSIALAAQSLTEPSAPTNPTEEAEDMMAMFAKKYGFGKFDKYKKFYKDHKTKGQTSSSGNFRKPSAPIRKFHSGKGPDGDLVCFNCRKPGHFMSACPQPKYEYLRTKPNFRTRKLKGLVAEQVDRPIAEWADTDEENDSDSDDFTEQANVCLMAFSDEVSLPLCQQAGYVPSPVTYASHTDTLAVRESNPSVGTPSKPSVPNYKRCGNSLYGSDPSLLSTYTAPTEILRAPTPKPVSLSKRDDSCLNEYTQEELVDLLQEMFLDFENLRKIHTTLSKELQQTSKAKTDLESEIKGLKDDLVILPIMRLEKKALDDYAHKLKEENIRLSRELRELTAKVEPFNKSKAAVQTLLEYQRTDCGTTGLGFSLNTCLASTSGTKECLEVSHCAATLPDKLPSAPKVTKLKLGGLKYSAVPHSYPKTATQTQMPKRQSLKNGNALYGPAKTSVTKASGSKAKPGKPSGTNPTGAPSVTIISCAPNRKPAGTIPSPVKPTVTNPPQQIKTPITKSHKATPPAPIEPCTSLLLPSEFKCLHKCDLCFGSGHVTHECLLRYTPGSRGRNASKVAQVWIKRGV